MSRQSNRSTPRAPIADPYINSRELGELLKISRITIYRLRLKGELPAPIRVGNQLRWRRADVESHLHRQPATASA